MLNAQTLPLIHRTTLFCLRNPSGRCICRRVWIDGRNVFVASRWSGSEDAEDAEDAEEAEEAEAEVHVAGVDAAL